MSRLEHNCALILNSESHGISLIGKGTNQKLASTKKFLPVFAPFILRAKDDREDQLSTHQNNIIKLEIIDLFENLKVRALYIF